MSLHLRCDHDGCDATIEITHDVTWPTPESGWGSSGIHDYCPTHRPKTPVRGPAACSTCLHPITEHHHAMAHCTHRVGDAACVCVEYEP